LRLRALELIEEKGHDRQAGQNDFKKALEDVENVEREIKSKKKRKDDSGESAVAKEGILDLDLVKTNPREVYPRIYFALKSVLKDWEQAMDERPGRSCLRILIRQLRGAYSQDRSCQTYASGKTSGCNSSSIS